MTSSIQIEPSGLLGKVEGLAGKDAPSDRPQPS